MKGILVLILQQCVSVPNGMHCQAAQPIQVQVESVPACQAIMRQLPGNMVSATCYSTGAPEPEKPADKPPEKPAEKSD